MANGLYKRNFSVLHKDVDEKFSFFMNCLLLNGPENFVIVDLFELTWGYDY